MKQKKPSPSKPKLSFTVDRSEFDISSDWVQAVMRPPSLPERAPFFSSDINNATDASSATGEKSPPVAEIASAENNAGVVDNTGVEQNATAIKESAAVAPIASVEQSAT